MRSPISKTATSIDRRLSSPRPLRERPSLIVFLFHNLFEDERQMREGLTDPQERLTPPRLRLVVEHLLEAGYEFVAADRIPSGLREGGRYAHMTFDDGYAPTLGAVELLAGYRVPVTLFVSTNHVEEGRPYWWDVVYRERRRQGRAWAVAKEVSWLKTKTHAGIEEHLRTEFGTAAERPVCDVDRPLTPTELRRLAAQPLVSLGNHTADHAVLTNYSSQGMKAQISGGQRGLERLAGVTPDLIAFPNGMYNRLVIDAARSCGLRLGVTVEARKNGLNMTGDRLMAMGRFAITCGDDLASDLRMCRSGIQLRHALLSTRQRLPFAGRLAP